MARNKIKIKYVIIGTDFREVAVARNARQLKKVAYYTQYMQVLPRRSPPATTQLCRGLGNAKIFLRVDLLGFFPELIEIFGIF